MNVAPEIGLTAFRCPHCDVYAHQYWYYVSAQGIESGEINEEILVSETALTDYDIGGKLLQGFATSVCASCDKPAVWRGHTIVFPAATMAPRAATDMPTDILPLYEEAASIIQLSPRGAAALLRLAVQKLCIHLGGQGENINADIKLLVSQGLPVRVSQALDIVRVTGNNAVHPGEMNIGDSLDTVFSLFRLINMIVEKMISEPKAVQDLFDLLPEGAKAQIERRDSRG